MKVFQPEKDDSNSISGRGVVAIYEDKNKNLWIGTLGGLNKFDRTNESFKSYRYNANDTNSINSNVTHCIYEDKNGRFWVGTGKGLNLFDRDNEIFTRFYFRYGDSKSHSASTPNQYNLCINAITEDPLSGDLLIGTETDGLWKFDVKEKTLSKYDFNADNNFDKKIGRIQSFHKARNGKIWMASKNTLSSLDPYGKTFKSYIEFPIMADQHFTKPVFVEGTVIEDQDGLIWSGFVFGERGVYCLNPATGSFFQYNLFPEKPRKINYNNIYSLYKDRLGILWIGTWGTGLMKFNRKNNKFQILKSDSNNFSNNLSHSLVYSITYDPKGFIWFCTPRALDKYDIKSGTYNHFLKNEECITQSFYFAIQDKSGYIWLGTSSCGLIRFDPINESYRFYFNDTKESLNLVNKQIWTMLQDHLGFLWIGTRRFGLYKYDIASNKLTQYKHSSNDPSSLSQDQVYFNFEDSFGTLWVGTNLGGLNKFDRKTEKFSYIGLSSIMFMYEDKQRNFWVADYYSGLNLVDREKGLIIANYNQKDGLAYNFILGILEDDHNNLWISTQNGLSKFNTKTRTFRNYCKEDGLPDIEFLKESMCGKGPDGTLYFDTNKGLIFFHPDSIIDDPTPPQVVLSGISLFDRPGEKLNYEGFISELKEITLPYEQNDLRFDFVGLHFSAPERNKYKYILENFNKDWVDAGNQRYATYTNLNPGEYIFRVTASNKDGVWNQAGISIILIITPPWWATTWAYIFYALAFISLIYFTWKLQVKRIKVKHEFEMSRFEAQKLHEVDELKSRFFTNLSHEFRTPLTLILGPAKQLLERLKDEKAKEDLDLIHRSAKKLNKLVDELLDISRIEAGEMKLKACPVNIVTLVSEFAFPFHSLAERKKIAFNFNCDNNEIIAYIDKDNTDKILTNVLSNAFKFTPEGGKVEIEILKEENNIQIIISDTGMGIPKNKIDKIFDRFYQVDGSHTREHEGTGIGLALTKELVELHKGRIEVESEEGKGSTFRITFPLGKDHLKPAEICNEESEKEKTSPEFDEIIERDEEHKTEIDLSDKLEKPSLLIVEDNSDVRKYIIGMLKSGYHILEAKDGEEGLNKSFEQIPDLIISDIMMPKLDGFQLCGKLKNDSRTSHIPVIMLTAKATLNDKINGLEIGADDYIMKPFEAAELKARIKNLLEQRKRLHEHFRKYGLVEIEERNITSVDQQFLQNAVSLISKHISESDFGVEKLADDMAISRSLLFKKVNALVGESPSEFIKRTRLNKAARLIEKNHGNISEIALEVGFNNPSYFAECFRKQFGVAPSQYHSKT
jgi:signal transduction histidine kinase/ligand-binding sensor domain-containing protein/AraC-like DNA-binding protein